MATPASATTGRYVPPSRRVGVCSSDAQPSTQDSYSTKFRSGGGSRGSDNDAYEIKIEGLSAWSDDESVRDMCAAFGDIKKLFVSIDKETQRCKGHAWVTFRKFTDMNRAIAKLHNMRVRTGTLSVTRVIQETQPCSIITSVASQKQILIDRTDAPQFDAEFPSLC